MNIAFTPWPDEFARRYRERGYWLDQPLTEILSRQEKNDAIALVDKQQSLSYRQLNQLSDRLAAALLRRGIRPGDTALVQLGNVVEFYVVFFALLKSGVVPVNALFSHQRSELHAYASQIKPALLIADREHGLFADDHFWQDFQEKYPSLRLVGLRNQPEGKHSLAAWMAEETGDFSPLPSVADQVAFFQLSGGSTGTPKLIPRTHNDYYYSIRRSAEICHFNYATRYLCALPAAHNYPMSSPGVLGTLYAGGLVVFAPDPSAAHCFTLIEQYQISVTALVPPAVTLWLQALEEWGVHHQLASLRLLQVGGAKLAETLARRIPHEIGCQLQQVFGMAEGLVNYTRLDDEDHRIFTTQGQPMCPDDEIWVADELGNSLPPGKIGRLMTRGPYTFRGYYQSPEENAAVFDQQGFYCTGDLVNLTPEGYVQVCGRQKDQINRGGEKIAAAEIENLLLSHPQIINAALVSIPDAVMGEKSCAFVVVHQAVKSVVFRRHLREQGIAEFKLPDHFIQVESLPLTPVGKVDKKRLREHLQAQQLAQIQGE